MPIARSLNTSSFAFDIGVVISYSDNPFYSRRCCQALAQKLDTLNYHLLLFVGDQEGNVDRIFDQDLCSTGWMVMSGLE